MANYSLITLTVLVQRDTSYHPPGYTARLENFIGSQGNRIMRNDLGSDELGKRRAMWNSHFADDADSFAHQ